MDSLTVRTSTSAAVGVVTESVDVHATLSVGVVAGHVPGHGGVGALGGLLEGDGALDVGVTTDNGNCSRGSMSAMCVRGEDCKLVSSPSEIEAACSRGRLCLTCTCKQATGRDCTRAPQWQHHN
jgi:hypothetical protein